MLLNGSFGGNDAPSNCWVSGGRVIDNGLILVCWKSKNDGCCGCCCDGCCHGGGPIFPMTGDLIVASCLTETFGEDVTDVATFFEISAVMSGLTPVEAGIDMRLRFGGREALIGVLIRLCGTP